MQSDIGSRIRKLRKQHQPPWSINNLALHAEIDAAQLSRAERGLAGFSLIALARIAPLLGISLAELVDPEHCAPVVQGDRMDMLIQQIIEHIWQGLKASQLEQCTQAECNLIRHYIRSSVEEGIKRSEMLAERELNLL